MNRIDEIRKIEHRLSAGAFPVDTAEIVKLLLSSLTEAEQRAEKAEKALEQALSMTVFVVADDGYTVMRPAQPSNSASGETVAELAAALSIRRGGPNV